LIDNTLFLKANAIINDTAKRLKQAEHQAQDFQKRVEELSSDLQSSNNDNQRLQAELTRIKVTVSDQQAKIDSLTRENSKLSGNQSVSCALVSLGDRTMAMF
jgi:predicted nuclease with TOPRIM domain